MNHCLRHNLLYSIDPTLYSSADNNKQGHASLEHSCRPSTCGDEVMVAKKKKSIKLVVEKMKKYQ